MQRAQASLDLRSEFARNAHDDACLITLHRVAVVGAHMYGNGDGIYDHGVDKNVMCGTDENHLNLISRFLPQYGYRLSTNPELTVYDLEQGPEGDFLLHREQFDAVAFHMVHKDGVHIRASKNFKQSPHASKEAWFDAALRSNAKLLINVVTSEEYSEDQELPQGYFTKAPYQAIGIQSGIWQPAWHTFQDYQFIARKAAPKLLVA